VEGVRVQSLQLREAPCRLHRPQRHSRGGPWADELRPRAHVVDEPRKVCHCGLVVQKPVLHPQESDRCHRREGGLASLPRVLHAATAESRMEYDRIERLRIRAEERVLSHERHAGSGRALPDLQHEPLGR